MADIVGFSQILQQFSAIDGFTLLIPFLLTFLVVKEILSGSNMPVFGDDDRLATVVALFISLLSANFLVQNPFLQGYFTEYFGLVAIGLIGILGFAALLGMAGYGLGDNIPLVAVIVTLVGISAFTLSGGAFAFLPRGTVIAGMSVADLYNVFFQTGLIYFVILGGFIYWAYAGLGDTRDDDYPYDNAGVALIDRVLGREKN